MNPTRLSRFTPSFLSHDALEAVFVQRERLADRLVSLIHEDAVEGSKHYTLLIGPRGIGKTHLLSLVYYRVQAKVELKDRLLIAWMREEEWGVTSFLEFLLRVFRALEIEKTSAAWADRIDALYDMSPQEAELAGVALLKAYTANQTLLILVENLDSLFKGIGEAGQKKLRAYLQETSSVSILATASRLFNGVSRQTSPFYGTFSIRHLEPLQFEDAIAMLYKVALFQKNNELASFLQTLPGRSRVRAIHHLAGGNHRIYAIFSQFLTRDSLDQLIEPFMNLIDDLTPYYQSQIASLPPQQCKIVEFLCEQRSAVLVKDIAKRCFLTQQTTSVQLRLLRDKGYVDMTSIGRESHYELAEPLMRLCIEIKKNRGEPLRLLVAFLRFWYTGDELSHKLEQIQPSASLEREYLQRAIAMGEETPDPRVEETQKEYQRHYAKKNFEGALKLVEELIIYRGSSEDWRLKGLVFVQMQKQEKALESFSKAIELNENNPFAWNEKSRLFIDLKRYEDALKASDQAIAIDGRQSVFWINRGICFGEMRRYEDALQAAKQAIEVDSKNMWGWNNEGVYLSRLGNEKEALFSFKEALEIDPTHALVWRNHGRTLQKLNRFDEALESLEKALEINPNYTDAWYNRGSVFLESFRYEEAIQTFEQIIKIDPNEDNAWNMLGYAYHRIHRHTESLESIEKAIEINPNDDLAWSNRAWALCMLDRYEEMLKSCEKAFELEVDFSQAYYNRAVSLLALNRWDEGFPFLEEAYERVQQGNLLGDEESDRVIYNLFLRSGDTTLWESRIQSLLQLFQKHDRLYELARGLTKSIRKLNSPMVHVDATQKWLFLWETMAHGLEDFAIPLRLLKAAVLYWEKSDTRVLLSLASEERSILKDLLETES